MENREANGSCFWLEETNDHEQTPIPMKHKRKVKAKPEFVGWGSKSLIEFLQSIGKDTDEQLSERDVNAIIIEYVHTLNLFHQTKKKKVVCDERLRSLFGKKSIPRIKIQDLLKSHFADNHQSSEDDYLYSSDEYEDSNITYKKHKVSDSEKKPQASSQKKKTPMSSFAAIIPENIKLLYLKKSLIQELIKHPESFEEKLLGSYIRIKCDPNDYSQKNSHQLLPITGVKLVTGNTDEQQDILLQVPNMVKDITINMLSDHDFSKEECDDLCQKVKDGLLKRPTVVEVEKKAQLLHEDIIKHWLPRELSYLQNLIDRANEKGWRRELYEYLERRNLLQKPSEQSKLLTEVPKVTPDALDPQDIQDLCSPDAADAEQVVDLDEANEGNQQSVENGGIKVISHVNSGEKVTTGGFEWVESVKICDIKSPSDTLVELNNNVTNVIELSDDEDDDNNNNNNNNNNNIKTQGNIIKEENVCDVSLQQWFYLDPQGKIQGPVSRIELKCWSDAGYFQPDFKVWKDGQVPENAVLLTDMLSGSF
ncbi:hypothetical protein Lser_V15G05981 [Lactuca serriola]